MAVVRRDRKRLVRKPIANEFFESLFNNVSEAIGLCDNNGYILKINDEFRRMFGYNLDEVRGRLIDDLVATESQREEAAVLTKTAADGEMFSTESMRRRKDGSLLHVSIIGAPIVIKGRQVAVYGIYRNISDRKEAEQALVESQRKIMETYASLQQRTRQLEEANAQLERLSYLDGLTSIPNRRNFEDRYRTEWRRACRDAFWISLIMIDVDFFKNYNDHHGHLSGDDCLKRIAKALSENNRAGDLVARYGGEEFVAMLLSSSREGGLNAAERMRLRVKDLQVIHGQSSVSPYVTISLGVASQRADVKSDPMDLLDQADQALYRAKANGRDRVEAAPDVVPIG